VRPGELETHFVQELERLYKLSASSRVRRLSLENSRPPLPPGSNVSSGPRRDGIGSAGDGTPEGRWEVSKRCSIRGLYRPLEVQEVEASRISRKSAHECDEVSFTPRPPVPPGVLNTE
jgi:hypothetical protein